MALPGVGEYTAGAVASICFDRPVAAVDGNVLRVLSRFVADASPITDPAVKKRVKTALEAVYPQKAPGAFTQALMELGATVCVPNGAPKCADCPLNGHCRAHLEGKTALFPVKAQKKQRKTEQRTVFLLRCGEKLALEKRPSRGLLAGLWEYPNELGDKMPEEWGIKPVSDEFGCTAKHIFTHIEWHLTARIVCTETDIIPGGWVWADRNELKHRYAIPNAFDGVAHLIEKEKC